MKPTDRIDHPLFGPVYGDLAERARRHDELLGLDRPLTENADQAAALARRMKDHVEAVVAEVGRVLKGDLVAERVRAVVEAVLTRSHVLLEGASGTGKTVAVTLVAEVLDFPFERIDALPDLSDLDIIGGEVFEGGEFRLKRSKLLRPLVLMIIDEFGRLSATCANAFLQALEEREVSISDLRGSGVTRLRLSPAFVVAAAMNPQTYGGGGGINEALFDRISVGLRMPMPNHLGLFRAVAEVRSQRPRLGRLPLPCTLRQIWSAIDFVSVPDDLIHAIINANFFVSPPAYRAANGWTECAFSATRKEKGVIAELEADSTRYLFEGSNPRGMALTIARARANAFFRGAMTVQPEDVRRAAQAALLFRLKSYPGTSPAVILDLINRAVDLTIPKGRGTGE